MKSDQTQIYALGISVWRSEGQYSTPEEPAVHSINNIVSLSWCDINVLSVSDVCFLSLHQNKHN